MRTILRATGLVNSAFSVVGFVRLDERTALRLRVDGASDVIFFYDVDFERLLAQTVSDEPMWVEIT